MTPGDRSGQLARIEHRGGRGAGGKRHTPEQIIGAISRWSVFTIAESPGFAEAGGVANFVIVDERVRFEICKKAAERAGLTVSSTLLRLVMMVD